MADGKRFYVLIIISVVIIFAIIANNLFGNRFSEEITSYIQRFYHYEMVISKKGLSLHRAVYWREER